MSNYMIVGKGARGPNPDDKAINTFGAHFAEVDVNVETGQVRVRRIVTAHDIGRVINPMTATSQVYGGVLMGLGFSTTEQRVLDGPTGLQLTANLEDYKVPVIGDVPEIDVLFVDQGRSGCQQCGEQGPGRTAHYPGASGDCERGGGCDWRADHRFAHHARQGSACPARVTAKEEVR